MSESMVSHGRRRALRIAGLGALGLFGAACSAGQGGTPLSDLLPLSKGPVEKNERVEFRRRLKAAPGLPEVEPAVQGLFVRREDNSVFVGTGNVKLKVVVDTDVNGGKSSVKAEFDGPVKEILIGRDTVFYKDITPANVEAMKKGEEIQQQVEPVASLDALLTDVSTNDTLTVWGEQRGERLVAKTVVYARPALPDPPAP